jgi:hypothetical protein
MFYIFGVCIRYCPPSWFKVKMLLSKCKHHLQIKPRTNTQLFIPCQNNFFPRGLVIYISPRGKILGYWNILPIIDIMALKLVTTMQSDCQQGVHK